MELMMALAIGSLVLTAVMLTFVNGLQATTRVTDRVEAAQRARLAMDRVVTLLNSQTCLYTSTGTTSVPIVDGQAQQVTFYANLGLVSADPVQYRLRYDAATKRIFEDQFVPTRDPRGNPVYPTSVTATKTVASDIVPTLAGGVIFQYYQFNTDGTINTVPLGAPLTAATRLQAVRVGATFAATPESTKTLDLRSTTVDGSATVGSAEGSDSSKGVNC
jgi:Tfp pilus assembly protein PilW